MAAEWDRYLKQARKRRAKIISLYKKGRPIPILAAQFKVSAPRIHQIINAKPNGTKRR